MEKMMKAAFLERFHEPLVLRNVPVPEPGPGEVLIKVRGCGLCPTDLHIREGRIASIRPPYIPGHEVAGTVEALGEGVTGHPLGEHVVVGIDVVCGTCDMCRRGMEHLCRNRVRIGFERNGGQAEYCCVPAECLVPIRADIPLDEACIIPDAVACMYHAVKDVGSVGPGDRILIYGAGSLGIQGVQIAKYLGAHVTVAGRTQAKLDASREAGADALINTREEDLEAESARLTGGLGFDVIFDMIGIQETIDRLLHLTRPAGKLVLVGYAAETFSVNTQETVVKEKQILGIRGSTRQNLRDCVRLVEEGILKPHVYKMYPLEEINTALGELEHLTNVGRVTLSMP